MSWFFLWMFCIAMSSAYVFLFSYAVDNFAWFGFESKIAIYLTLPNMGVLFGWISNDFELSLEDVMAKYNLTKNSIVSCVIAWHLVWNATCASLLWLFLH